KYIKEYPETLIEKNGYDPRIRIWYKTALENSMNSWSDIYIFNTDNLPGITNVTPVYKDGIFKGVIGIDLDISSMSIYLSSLELSQYGQIYILDKNRNIVMRTLDGEKLTEIVSINNVSDPIILEAYKSGLKRDRIISIEFNNKRYLSYYTFFDLFDQLSFSMGIIIPEDYLLAESNKNLKGLIIIGIIIIFISFLLVIVLSEKIIEPLEKLSLEFKKVRNFIFNSNYQDKVYISEIKQINSDFGRMKSGLYSFSKYIPSNVVRQLIKIGNVAIPGGDKKELTILFSDIKDFTATSELLKPEDLITQLMNYLGSLSDLIIQNQGTIDKYIGDAIMAFWGAPESDIHHAYNACHSALLCQTYLKNSSYPFEETRIGIHTGDVIVGNLGSENRLNYTVIGDNVNISSRLEGLNKYYGTKIIISSTTYNKVSNKFICRKLDRVAVKGKTQGMEIYELIREKTDEFDRDQYSELYSEAVDLFLNKDLERSRAIFNKIKDLGENTIALNKMLERFDSWSDINVFKTK
ncbi:MAG: hypothetical protein JXR64_10320, partial [Spirochaetales bacterium]|nr:hypothetical protein [Spirochaetales bacterium]